MEVKKLVDGIRDGETQSLAKAVTLVEKRTEEGEEVIKEIFSETGNSHIIGITGFPGVGKSTLISRMIERFRDEGKTVGVIATDPSSPFTGGALLGDRLRLSGHDSGSDLWTDPGVFYRSVSTKGEAGGISQITGDVISLMDAFEFDKIIVETAGAGQSEVDIVEVVDTSVVVIMPGVGDRIQFGKAGIMEIADIFVVNKSDLDGASEVKRFLKEMQSFDEDVRGAGAVEEGEMEKSGSGHCTGGSKFGKIELEQGSLGDAWVSPIILTIAEDERDEGVEQFIKAIEEHRDYLEKSGKLGNVRKARARRELETVLGNMIVTRCSENPESDLEGYAEKVANRDVDPYTAAEKILRTEIQKG